MGLSIERQARFLAGLFALVGTVIGVMIDYRLLLIPAVVGVGLMFSAVAGS